MGKVDPELTEFVRAAIEKAGLRLDEVADKAREIIVFGSRAAGVHSPHSDLDLLFVSPDPGRRLKSSGLDIVWLRPEAVDSPNWHGSELAGHVAAYGRWLSGPDAWKAEVFTSPTAIQKKQRQLADRIQALEASWRSLAPAYRRRLFTLIRRDLQRLELLRQARPVSPTPLLDHDWERTDDPMGNLVRLLKQASNLGDRDKAHFASHAAELLSRAPVPT